MSYFLTCNELIILRDGTPFGMEGVFGGKNHRWPLSQTIGGMLRTKAGFSISENYFNNKENCRKILDLKITNQIPAVINDETGSHEYLAPLPADIVWTAKANSSKININIPNFTEQSESSGSDIANMDWLIPLLDLKEKPTGEVPFMLNWDFFIRYLSDGSINGTEGELDVYGIKPPVEDIRIHNAISNLSMTAENGRLFSNKGIHLYSKRDGSNSILGNSLGILFNAEGMDINLSGPAYLGGEKVTVQISETGLNFPKCPKIFDNKKFLKLILGTHGDFGSWYPDWLKPDLAENCIEWVTVPDTNIRVRMRTAFVKGWTAVSGWDYEKREPKAMKKLVPPGTVYLIELEDKNQSSALAELLWGKCICGGDGYGQLFIGNMTTSINNLK